MACRRTVQLKTLNKLLIFPTCFQIWNLILKKDLFDLYSNLRNCFFFFQLIIEDFFEFVQRLSIYPVSYAPVPCRHTGSNFSLHLRWEGKKKQKHIFLIVSRHFRLIICRWNVAAAPPPSNWPVSVIDLSHICLLDQFLAPRRDLACQATNPLMVSIPVQWNAFLWVFFFFSASHSAMLAACSEWVV